ncbi:hypothetical protein CASFOL_010515 [Castilleja foliolosa]|uniref:Uncharacterized protein n=1 Tax=Castilleja foliolosa TaxID=1961234 RepID=A0ABD3DSY8_9LAMI
MASLVYLVLYLYLHACSARPLTVPDKGTVNKVRFTISDHRTNVLQMDDQKPSPIKEAENIEGKQVKVSYSLKIWKRAERSTLESPPCKTVENVSSKDSDSEKDIVVMDYALPHRKPPIHNRGT